ncbi:hypothetical protein CH63R_10036 [Colletotrichum higginsianum IMI 349063]|uniref:Uncharacterized protein n=1 Tax=Colletotrichum higginsianum (strain IMI 349063) TaxID=759273 RepID=A0A1B7Y1M8_COLHI|nr:uncharacterized protein CH63R_10036 [Colletotrichum higginsianum IMI 349063]OBR05916.1 hypothetical protein CH63R_10036 [Colletotrichum higginsianum IMI 349063]
MPQLRPSETGTHERRDVPASMASPNPTATICRRSQQLQNTMAATKQSADQPHAVKTRCLQNAAMVHQHLAIADC